MQAAASVVVDTTVGVITQLIFVLSGVGLLLMRSTDHNSLLVAGTVLIAMGILFVAITAFVFFQFTKFARRLMPGKWLSALAARASRIDDSVVAAYRSGPVMLRANLLRLVGWAAGAGEVWLVMQSLGQPIGVVDAISSKASVAAFARQRSWYPVPSALLRPATSCSAHCSDYQRTQRW